MKKIWTFCAIPSGELKILPFSAGNTRNRGDEMEKWKIFAFADEASPWLDGQIAALKRNGLSGLELRNVDHQNVSELTKEKAREIRRRLDDEGLAV